MSSQPSPVEVDFQACDRVAALLASQQLPDPCEEANLPGLPPGAIGNFFLGLVAICHQTSPSGSPPLEGTVDGCVRRGWDYLLSRFEAEARVDRHLLEPSTWSWMSADRIRDVFRDSRLGDRLSGLERRAELLRDLGTKMLACGWNSADELHRACEGRISSGRPNLLETLRRFRAYDDPVRKKSLFFLSIMRSMGRWKYVDDESLGPPVDYHEVRGHLRLETVRITDAELQRKVQTGRPVTPGEDIAIRSAVFSAIMRISEQSGSHDPTRLHYMFWNVFRAVCKRESPECYQLSPQSALPTHYVHMAIREGRRQCPFSGLCASAGRANPLREHVFETDYY